MTRRFAGVGLVARLGRPESLAVLRRAGLVNPHHVAAALGSTPWLVGRGPSLGILSQINAWSVGSKPAVHDRLGTLTWRDVDRKTNRLARAFLDLGVGRGDTVATLLRNGREAVETLLAAQKAGIALAPLNTWATPDELRAMAQSARPSLVVADRRHAEAARQAVGDARLVVAGPDRRGAGPYDALLRGHSDRPLSPLGPAGGAHIVIHTSGTTGRPKGALRDVATPGPEGLIRMLDMVPLRRHDVILVPAPLFHSFGLFVLSLGMVLGATFVLPDRFDAEETLDQIEARKVTACAVVPVMLARIGRLPADALEGRALGSVRVVLSGGSTLDTTTRHRASAIFGPTLYDVYGSTEAGWVSVATPRDMAERPGTVGRPIPGVEVSIVREDGTRADADEPGRIVIGGDGVFEGYLDSPSTDLVPTGDVGRLDRHGYLWVEGRADDLMVVGGENVRPVEIEDVIASVEGVEEVAVAGVPDEEYGRVPVAFVAGSAEDERILGACRSRLASYKVPRRIIRRGALPRTATGKPLVRSLVEELGRKE